MHPRNIFSRISRKTTSLIVMGFFLFVFFVGPLHAIGMNVMNHVDKMEHEVCPLMSMPQFCQMNSLEHLTQWQNLFSTILTENAFLLSSLFIVFLLVSRHLFFDDLLRQKSFAYRAHHRRIFFDLRFQELFSSGILNPKLF